MDDLEARFGHRAGMTDCHPAMLDLIRVQVSKEHSWCSKMALIVTTARSIVEGNLRAL